MSSTTPEPPPQSTDATETKPAEETQNDFASAAESQDVGFVREFVEFLIHNGKWFLAPIVVALLILSLIVLLGGTAAAPFIYTLF